MRRSPDAGAILKIARATYGKSSSRKLRNTLLGYIKKQQMVEFMLLHSKNASFPNIQKFSGGTLDWAYANFSREKSEKFE